MPASDGKSASAEPFVFTAIASLLFGTVWLLRERELMLGHFYRPELLSITHTITLGWISMLMMGILVRLAPRALGIKPPSRTGLIAQFVLMLVGFTGMVFHFWISQFVGMAWAAIVVLLAACLQLYNFREVMQRLRGPEWLPRYVLASMINFLLAAILGTLLGFNKVYDIIGGQFFPNIFAHAHLAGLGWVTTMIIGFEHRLLPTSKPRPKTYWGGVRFWLLEGGTIGLVTSLLAVSPWAPLFAAAIALALWMHAARPLWTLFRGKVQDRATFWATLALVFLLADSITGLLLVANEPDPNSVYRMRLQFAYGYVGLIGWVTSTITAQAYKLFPMFVWEERFRSEWGKQPVPAMRDLYSTALQTLSNGFIVIGVCGTVAGMLLGYLPVITFFHGIVIIGAAAFATNFFLIARWTLLKTDFRPAKEDWERFHMNFPDAPIPPGVL